jgi:ribosomal protein S12 methylthiotransferase accessory factor
VPHGAASYVDSPGEPLCYELTTSNGLAAGNSLEAAICHALCELVERDALTEFVVVGERLGSAWCRSPTTSAGGHSGLHTAV